MRSISRAPGAFNRKEDEHRCSFEARLQIDDAGFSCIIYQCCQVLQKDS